MQRHKVSIWWQGQGGLRWCQLLPRLRHFLTLEHVPQMLIIHCGGNDIGVVNSCELRHNMKSTMRSIEAMLPNTKLVWSQILPRRVWRGELNHASLEKTRQRINSFMSSFLVRSGVITFVIQI